MEPKYKSQRGIVALLTVIIISLLLASFGLLMGIQSRSAISSNQLLGQAQKAQMLAEAGVEDALIKIARNSSTSGTYTIREMNASTTVMVTQGSPVIINATSTVSVGSEQVQRAIEAQVTLDVDGQITNLVKVGR